MEAPVRVPSRPPPAAALAVETQILPQPAPRAQHVLTRMLSLLALLCMAATASKLLTTAYHAWNDAFITPLILSPESDLVLPSKLSLAHLLNERQTQEVRITEATQAIRVAERGIEKLRALRTAAESSLAWTDTITARTRTAATDDLQTLAKQRALLDTHIAAQEAYVQELKQNVDAGLARRADLAREESSLRQMQIAALENERERAVSAATKAESTLAQDALHAAPGGTGMATPEMLQRQDHLVRIELEQLKLEADAEARRSELRVARDLAHKLDELISQMRQRPIFRAIDAKQDVAFVPYTQSDKVEVGAQVYDCRLFGLLSCEPVGRVLEVLPGEANMSDPWGTPTRGQYALLGLDVPDAAKMRSLRVRPLRSAEPWAPAQLVQVLR